ncbi:DHH phosphoesterase [Russula ochroleuca]|uniref:DHH phosphoesterase n=1 Tax=Russula ochroleuca TaxID=152965 RepID=A0A9P5MPU3_9AGAM|nr:DHH phosphoesterase [Russula ochroleuca]
MSEAAKPSESNGTPSNISEFLLAQKSAYLRAVAEGVHKDIWTISMGNEAGDLDSLASAIAYAWYATCYLGQPTVPLLQTPRADLSLRAENLYALEFSGVDAAHLLTGDELPADTSPAGKYVLLDHNALTGRFAEDENACVVAIVDHHADEERHPEASPRIVESPTGSCSSLIGRHIQKEWEAGMSRPVARLLLCAVLIDTGGLKAGGKAEVTDRKVAPFLLERAELVSPGAGTIEDVHDVKEARELTRILTTRKSSVGLLSPRDLLRRDYKEYRFVPAWTAEGSLLVGLASVPRSIEAITGGDQKGQQELAAACAAWVKERGLDMLGVLTSWKDEKKGGRKGKHRRETLWVVRDDEEMSSRLWKGLEGSAELELERKKSGIEEAGGQDLKMRMYEQGDGQATRKVIAPLVRAIIEIK